MKIRIEIEVDLEGNLVTDHPSKKPTRVENFKVFFRDENITQKIESKILDKLESEYLEYYADSDDSKYEYRGVE